MERLVFEALQARDRQLHFSKQQDYGATHDPLQNMRSCTEFGIPAWKGALVRMGDKVQRLKKFAKDGSLTNEGFLDSLQDLRVYSYICEILYLQETKSCQSRTATSSNKG